MMIQIQARQVDFHPAKLDLGMLVRGDKLKAILKYSNLCTAKKIGSNSLFPPCDGPARITHYTSNVSSGVGTKTWEHHYIAFDEY